MKQFISTAFFAGIFFATLLSFTYFGGEGFEIYLNNKVVIQKFGEDMNNVQKLTINAATADEQLVVKYHHCGKIGKNRVIAIRDENNKLLKEWRFADANKPVAAMQCKVKDIIDLGKRKTAELNLYYSSSELPKGRQLTSIVLGNSSLASVK